MSEEASSFVIESQQNEPHRRVDQVRVPADSVYFRGHFEGNPVLPGVAQLLVLAHERAREGWPDLAPIRRVNRLKFERPIGPGSALEVVLERSTKADEELVKFVISGSDGTCSSATLVYGAHSGEPQDAQPHSAFFDVESGAGSRRRSEYPELTSFMPHRAPMLLLDRLDLCTREEAECEKRFRDSDLFVRGEGGRYRVSTLIAVELFAQTAAAHVAYLARKHGSGMASGALLGCRKLELAVESLEVDEPLGIRVRQSMSMPPLAQYECELIRQRGERFERVASAAINVAMGAGPPEQRR